MTRNAIREVLASAAGRLAQAGIGSARLDARVLLGCALGVRSEGVFAAANITAEQLETFHRLVARRAAREPVAYITGRKEFFSLDFDVGPGVLIPRPESETLVEEALRKFPDRDADLKVLDLGTGSGCLIVAFLSRYRQAHGVGVDASAEALVWAARNVERHGLAGRCGLRQSGWNVSGAFDVVFANPPYLTEDDFARAEPEIRQSEPKEAFVAGCDGLASYRALGREFASTLKPEGLAFVEIGGGHAQAVTAIIEENGLELRHIAPDLAGIPRCVIVGRPGRIRPASQKTVGKEPATR